MSEATILDAAVIGAGPSGLILARQLGAKGVNFKVFERHNDVGGIWDIDAPNSPMYESAHFISSRTLSGFPDFPMPDDFPDYPNHRQLLSYIKSYAEAFDLRRHIQFNQQLDKAEQDANGIWQLHFTNGEVVQAKYLICANGVTWEANQVTWPGEFNGEIRHSVSYRSSEEFKDKRVLIIGAGNSGVDIACDAAFAAEQAFLSVRRGYYFMPKHIMGKPSDVFNEEGPKLPLMLKQPIFAGLLYLLNGDLRRYGLPKPDHKVFQTHPILNTQILHYLSHGDCIAKPDVTRFDGDDVVFSDGSREKIDLVITATGYKHKIPFLQQGEIAEKDGRPDLYLNIFSRQHKNLAVLGFIEFASAAYKNFSAMAELIVADVANENGQLKQMKQNHQPDLRGKAKYLSTERNANYVNVDTYLKVLDEVKQQLGLATA